MDSFSFHSEVIDEYARYVRSFIEIKDDRIRETVEDALSGQSMWPHPLVQFNPAYATIQHVDALCDEGILHSRLKDVFSGFNLYRHQVQALRHGTSGENFVVTSGTGSGKSLTYLGTVFDHVFRHPATDGILAIIVYPMNALINSQVDEIGKYRDTFEEATGTPFPIRFAQYTGQTSQPWYMTKLRRAFKNRTGLRSSSRDRDTNRDPC